MSQYKPNPFVEALNVIAPVLAPSFQLVSLRDELKQKINQPTLNYVIVSITNKVWDNPTKKFRTTYEVLLNAEVLQATKPANWCEYDELKDAQDIQSLLYKLEILLQDILIMLINPSKFSKDLSNEDILYSKYQFVLESFRDAGIYSNKGTKNSTGVSIDFNLSFLSDENTTCCVDDNSKEIAEKFQTLVKENSISYKLLQKRIDS